VWDRQPLKKKKMVSRQRRDKLKRGLLFYEEGIALSTVDWQACAIGTTHGI
jgi:hypothetical protein